MTDFSIEMAAERITDRRTRQYFEEVHRSYVGGNYRSAVVMLWSVVVCDLLFKLDQLGSAYADAGARSLLEEVEQARTTNPRSPEWESQLLEKVKGRTHLLHEADYENLQHLQKHRHLSAHPVLTEAEALFSPNRETTRAHIRNALEGLLTKPAIMTRKVFNALVEDLEAVKDRLPDDRSLKRYLEAKYFPHLVVPVEDAIFRSLWSLTFKVANERCEANRVINYRALRVLYERRPQDINRLIDNDKAYFGQVAVAGTPLDCLLAFLREHPTVFPLLDPAARILIEKYTNETLDRFATAWFLSDNVEQHIEEIARRVRAGEAQLSEGAFGAVAGAAREHGCLPRMIDAGIGLYGHSPDYDTADKRFEAMIRPLLADYSADQVRQLLRAIEGNRQTYDRRRAKADHAEVRVTVHRLLGPDADLTEYRNFRESLR